MSETGRRGSWTWVSLLFLKLIFGFTCLFVFFFREFFLCYGVTVIVESFEVLFLKSFFL